MVNKRKWLYLIPVFGIYWFCHWSSPYDYFEQGWGWELFACLLITPMCLGALIAWLVIGAIY